MAEELAKEQQRLAALQQIQTEAVALLQTALVTFEDLQTWQGPEGEQLGEPEDPKCR